jgi:hypothetical protein
MFLLLIIIFTLSAIAMIYLLKEDSYSNYVWTAFVMNLLIVIIAAVGMIRLIGPKYERPKIQDKSTNTKDSVIVKDSLLILNMNDTVRIFNINKL